MGARVNRPTERPHSSRFVGQVSGAPTGQSTKASLAVTAECCFSRKAQLEL
jgi:hypothetical protein